jgi:hypothetical protein
MTTRSQRRALTRSSRRAARGRRLRHARAQLRRELGPQADLFRLERACPCGACGHFDADMVPRPDGWAPPEVRAVHDAHTARLLALWEVTVWRPESIAAGWLRLVLATIRLGDAVRVLVAAGLRACRAVARRLRLPAVDLATSLDLSPPAPAGGWRSVLRIAAYSMGARVIGP